MYGNLFSSYSNYGISFHSTFVFILLEMCVVFLRMRLFHQQIRKMIIFDLIILMCTLYIKYHIYSPISILEVRFEVNFGELIDVMPVIVDHFHFHCHYAMFLL